MLTMSDREVIRGKVYRLVGANFSADDGAELEQDALLHLWRRLQRYQPARGKRKAFVSRVVANFIAARLTACQAKKRKPRGVRSLSDPAGPVGAGTLADIIERRHQDAARGRHRQLDEAAAIKLAVEVADVLAGLPEPHRKFAGLLMQGETLVDAARILRIHRATAMRWAHQIGEALQGNNRTK
jgi:DNA-directed RNA polymerase specialized sigma24 family protein